MTENLIIAIGLPAILLASYILFYLEDKRNIKIGDLMLQVACLIIVICGVRTDIALSNNNVAENSVVNTVVCSLSSTDQDAGDTHTFTLVAGSGDTDNASFNISGTNLRTSAIFDFETKSSYSIRVQTNDGNGGTFQKQFTITVTNGNDAPTDIALSTSSVAENSASGTPVGTFTSTDQDADTHTYTLAAGPGDTDNASFTIAANELRTNAVFDFETKSSYSIRVQT